ncbi:ATP-binding cassette domain-containing protein, partial [Escherichia coli]|uniref:ATP-binding cassette domain-containing protein n=2 Tax=Pseudomonadota TaxID=1224 RepID=UPI00202F2D57
MADASLKDTARDMLGRVGLLERADIPSAELSHGERRQLEIAIALALGPKAFLLDEPMAGMGPE